MKTVANVIFVNLVLILGLANRVQSASLLTNASFETPTVPVAGEANFNTGSTGITGWTVVGPQVSIVSGSTTQLGFTLSAEDGTQWLDLTGNGTNSDLDGVTQSLPTAVGTTYTLSYFVGNIVNPGGPLGTSSTVNVYVNGTLIQVAANTGAGAAINWEQFQTPFIASSSLTAITFRNGDPATDNLNGLDNVVVNAATPEPSSLPVFTVLAVVVAGVFAHGRLKSQGGSSES